MSALEAPVVGTAGRPGTAPGSRRTTSVRPAAALPEAERARWVAFQRADATIGSPFLRPELLQALARHRPDLQVAVVEEDGEPVAFLPFERRRFGLARAAGYDLFDHQAVVAAPGTAVDGRAVLADCGVRSWQFDHLVGEQVAAFSPDEVELQDSPVLDLSDGYEAWLAGRRAHSSSRMKKAVQKRRKLERELPGVRFELDCRDPQLLETLMAWKSAQYRRTLRGDRFARPGFADAVREVFASRGDGFAGVLSALYADGRPIALYFGLRSDDVYAGWFPAYDPAAAASSPGLVQLLCLVEALAADGVRQFDLGEGEADYKETFKTGDLVVAAGAVRTPSLAVTAHRLATAPRRAAEDLVLSSPPLRLAARRALRAAGGVRDRLSRP